MEADMACKCGGSYIVKDGKFVCGGCGSVSPIQPKPSYEELEQENIRLKKRIKELENTTRKRV